MTLTEQEYIEFLKTHIDLLYYVGKQQKVIAADTTLKKFANLDLSIKFKCREALLDNEYLLDDYLSLNFDDLTNDQVSVLGGFKKKIRSDFVIFKCLNKYAIFIDTKTNKFYAVKALGDPFDYFFDYFPVLVNATILPFKDKIIYDGFLQSQGVYYGPGMKQSMNEEYNKAKKRSEIQTTL